MSPKSATQEKLDVETTEATPNQGGTSIILDGQEHVFQSGQSELPGMPDATKLRKLAEAYVYQDARIGEEEKKQAAINQEIMLELRSEGRGSFAFRHDGELYTFEITTAAEKLKVKKK